MKELIEKLLEEVDIDIKEEMLRELPYTPYNRPGIVTWETLPDPALTIIEWQRLRNKKKSLFDSSKYVLIPKKD